MANKYKVGAVTLETADALKISEEAKNLKDKSAVPKAWDNSERVAQTTAQTLKDNPDKLRLDPNAADELQEAASRAAGWNAHIAALEQLLAWARNANLLADGEVHTRLLEIRRQLKAQLPNDPTLAELFAELNDYHAHK